jgi:hypothetical protein
VVALVCLIGVQTEGVLDSSAVVGLDRNWHLPVSTNWLIHLGSSPGKLAVLLWGFVEWEFSKSPGILLHYGCLGPPLVLSTGSQRSFQSSIVEADSALQVGLLAY